MTHWSAAYGDDKVVLARRLLREGKSANEMAGPLGYKTSHGVRKYLRTLGLPLTFGKGKKVRQSQPDDERQSL